MTLEPKSGGFQVRLRYGRDAQGKAQRDRFFIATKDETVAADIDIRMHAAAASLAKLQHPKAREFLTEMGKVAGDEKAFRALEAVLRKLVAEAGAAPPAAPASGPTTFREIADYWTSGEMLRGYPDSKNVKPKSEDGRKADRGMLAVFFPVLGNLPIADITDAQIAEAKRAIPAGLDPDTRVIYLKRLRSVFRLARRPLRRLQNVPEEAEDLPRGKKRSLFWFLYPDEDARLLFCTRIPLAYRILYGWLTRNGTRITETLRLTHDHLDLERGRVRLEAGWTKTGRARYWDLEPDVTAAMKLWREYDGNPPGSAPVFHGAKTKSLTRATVRDRFLADLLLAGVDRKELHVTTAGSRKLRVHDLRASFCTMARRRGMTDTWIMDRSGHENPAEIQRSYARMVRHADEQGLPEWFASLDRAIPEFREMGQPWARPTGGSRKHGSSVRTRHSMLESETEESGPKTPEETGVEPPRSALPTTSGPASFQGVGQSGPGQAEVPPAPTEDPVEKALAFAITEATRAGRWDVVLECTRELHRRELHRKSPEVSSLSDARKKREEGK